MKDFKNVRIRGNVRIFEHKYKPLLYEVTYKPRFKHYEISNSTYVVSTIKAATHRKALEIYLKHYQSL